jgi:transcriptional regulator with XRE-family HTH domain
VIDNWVRRFEGDPEFEFDILAIDIGERIVERMEELGMTRTALAAAMGVSKARISQILSGNDNLTLKSLVAVAIGLESRIEVRLKSAVAHSDSLLPRIEGLTKSDLFRLHGSVEMSIGPETVPTELTSAA